MRIRQRQPGPGANKTNQPPPPFRFPRRVSAGDQSSLDGPMPPGMRTLRDLDQPFVFELRGRRGRRFRLEFRDPDGPGDWRLLRPDLVLVCYDIGRRATLARLLTVVSLCADGSFFFLGCLFIYWFVSPVDIDGISMSSSPLLFYICPLYLPIPNAMPSPPIISLPSSL